MSEANAGSIEKALFKAYKKVFESTLTCESDLDLGRACLAAAEELTGSRFGFIDELNASGKVDVIAISDPG